MATIYHPYPEDIAASMTRQWPAIVDPTRLEKAVILVSFHGLNMAHKDENGKKISPTWYVLAVQGTSKNPYIVRKGSCTCPDSSIAGHVCKHRLAFYIFQKLMEEGRNAN